MLLMIDNYDSFTFNLVQYFGELGEEVRVVRNDEITLEGIGERIVMAPDQDRSGASSSLTLDRPLQPLQLDNGFISVNGTPTDCVHLAVTGMLDHLPDMVVSGINNGANMGDDTIYSGTVAAAMEGYLFGVPAIAFSQVEKGWAHLDAAAQVARRLVLDMAPFLPEQPGKTAPWLLNVNIPNLPLEQLKPRRLCRLGRRHAAESVISQVSPRGVSMYWIGNAGAVKDATEGTDFHATADGHISVTPLQVDLTDHQSLGYWAQAFAMQRPEGARKP